MDRVPAAGILNLSLLVPAVYNRKPKSEHTANPNPIWLITASDHIWLNWRCLHRPRTAFIPEVNHTLAPNSRKCLTYYDITASDRITYYCYYLVCSTQRRWESTTKPCLLVAILLYWRLETCTVCSSEPTSVNIIDLTWLVVAWFVGLWANCAAGGLFAL